MKTEPYLEIIRAAVYDNPSAPPRFVAALHTEGDGKSFLSCTLISTNPLFYTSMKVING